MIKVFIVEDSTVDYELLHYLLSADPEIQVIGRARNGEEAFKVIGNCKPDVITMDIEMPGMDGFEVTRKIMETWPTPIIVVSSHWNQKETAKSLQAMEAGAVATLEKPSGIGHPDHAMQAKQLVRTIKAMSGLGVVKRWSRDRYGGTDTAPSGQPTPLTGPSSKIDMVAIGASTGGPQVLQSLLECIGADFPAPILIVQHMTPGFLSGLQEWLEKTTAFKVHIASNGETPEAGHVYLAPDGCHMGLNAMRQIALTHAPAENGLRPAVSVLFRSVAEICPRSSVAILLTGMGRDGAVGLKLLRDSGAITFAQDEASSLIHGMPGEAIKLGAALYILPPAKIANVLCNLCARENPK